MDIDRREVVVETEDRIECRVVTRDIEAQLDGLDTTAGLVLARTGHTSAALATNEAEDRLLDDMLEAYTDLFPPDASYAHDQLHHEGGTQPNAFGHLLSTFIRRPVLVPVVDGKLAIGTYEEVLFFEFDGPRRRTIDVYVLR